MLIEHLGNKPQIDPTAYVAPNAVLCGAVRVGKNSRIMFGAMLIAENSPIDIGDYCIVLENAIIRGTKDLPVRVGDHCLIGPQAHLAGCTIEDQVFLATGATVFHGATVKSGSEIRVNGVVHANTLFPANQVLPIGWVAVGNPMHQFPPDRHNDIWAIQKEANFPELVYGIGREAGLAEINKKICETMSDRLKSHQKDQIV